MRPPSCNAKGPPAPKNSPAVLTGMPIPDERSGRVVSAPERVMTLITEPADRPNNFGRLADLEAHATNAAFCKPGCGHNDVDVAWRNGREREMTVGVRLRFTLAPGHPHTTLHASATARRTVAALYGGDMSQQ